MKLDFFKNKRFWGFLIICVVFCVGGFFVFKKKNSNSNESNSEIRTEESYTNQISYVAMKDYIRTKESELDDQTTIEKFKEIFSGNAKEFDISKVKEKFKSLDPKIENKTSVKKGKNFSLIMSIDDIVHFSKDNSSISKEDFLKLINNPENYYYSDLDTSNTSVKEKSEVEGCGYSVLAAKFIIVNNLEITSIAKESLTSICDK